MTPSQQQLLEATERVLATYPQGITPEQAVILACAELSSSPLDPFGFDDAAVLLRAELLVVEGLVASEALRTARREMATWGVLA